MAPPHYSDTANNNVRHIMSKPATTTSTTTRGTPRRHWQIPHIYVILFVFIAIAAVATYFVPAELLYRGAGARSRPGN